MTLYHWDLPQALQDTGGWAARDTAGLFADYAAIVAAPWATGCTAGSRSTSHGWWRTWATGGAGTAPGIRDGRQAVATAHHLLLAHGRAAAAVRAATPASTGPARTEVGITLNIRTSTRPTRPAPRTANWPPTSTPRSTGSSSVP